MQLPELKPIIIQPLSIKTEPLDSRCISPSSHDQIAVSSSPSYNLATSTSPGYRPASPSPIRSLASTRPSEAPPTKFSISASSSPTSPVISTHQSVDPILLKHVSVLQELVELQQSRLQDQCLTEVIQVYISAVKDIEYQRSQSYHVHSDTAQLQASHKLYNDQRLSLIQRASWDISRLKAGNDPVWLKHWSTVTFQSAVSKSAQVSLAAAVPSNTSPVSTQTFQPFLPRSPASTSTALTMNNHRNTSITSKTPYSGRSRATKAIDNYATKILVQWYKAHCDNPYPTNTQALQLAQQADLTVTQVQKWFANRRHRDQDRPGNFKTQSQIDLLDKLASKISTVNQINLACH